MLDNYSQPYHLRADVHEVDGENPGTEPCGCRQSSQGSGTKLSSKKSKCRPKKEMPAKNSLFTSPESWDNASKILTDLQTCNGGLEEEPQHQNGAEDSVEPTTTKTYMKKAAKEPSSACDANEDFPPSTGPCRCRFSTGNRPQPGARPAWPWPASPRWQEAKGDVRLRRGRGPAAQRK